MYKETFSLYLLLEKGLWREKIQINKRETISTSVYVEDRKENKTIYVPCGTNAYKKAY